jgi:hypothetical protein
MLKETYLIAPWYTYSARTERQPHSNRLLRLLIRNITCFDTILSLDLSECTVVFHKFETPKKVKNHVISDNMTNGHLE